MASPKENTDISLVGQCLSGSEPAWLEFYSRFHRLVRMVVRRRLRVSDEGGEDVVQEVFMLLMTALKNYDSTHSLQKFVCTIAERVSIDNFRFSTAAKRGAETQSFEDYLSSAADCCMDDQHARNQEEELGLQQQTHLLKLSMRTLGEKCRELLKLRFYDELPYLKMAEIIGATENTLTVQVARCIRELRVVYQKLVKKGARK